MLAPAFSRRHVLGLVAGSALAAAAPRPAAAQVRPLRVALIDLTFYRVVGGVIEELAARLNHPVEFVTGTHAEMFPVVASGAADILCAAWLPGAHAHLAREHAGALDEIAEVYDRAELFWSVPAYVPEAEVASIADLAKPEVAARMEPLIRSIGPSAGLSVRGLEAMRLYGLEAAGYRFEPGAASDWVAHFQAAEREGRWVVMPLWRPHWLVTVSPVRKLADPLGAYPPPDRCVLMANRAVLETLPPRLVSALRSVAIGLEGVEAMDRAVAVDGATPREAARAWLAANADRTDGWIAG